MLYYTFTVMSKLHPTIWYVTSLKIPTIWAHGVQIMKMCEAFSDAGIGVRLIAQQSNVLSEDPFSFYAVKHNFAMVHLERTSGIIEKIGISKIMWLAGVFRFGKVLTQYLIQEHALPDFFYAREYAILPFLRRREIPIFFEAHTPPGFFARYFLKRSLPFIVGIGVTTSYVKDALARFGVPVQKIILLPDGFSESDFAVPTRPKEELRRELGLPIDKKIIMYVGHLFSWKGVYTLAESSQYIGNKNPYEIVIIGGHEPDRKKLLDFINAHKFSHIRVIPRQEYRRVVSFLAAADMFVLPNSSHAPISRLYTSPIKMFEYMAAGRPIVASDLPSIRDILDEKIALLVKPDDPKDLACGITALLESSSRGAALAEAALLRSKEYTWGKRAEKIIEYLGKIS